LSPAPTSDAANSDGSLIGATVRPPGRKEAIQIARDGLKVRFTNKLFETIDVAKLESLEPAMVSITVTAANNKTSSTRKADC